MASIGRGRGVGRPAIRTVYPVRVPSPAMTDVPASQRSGRGNAGPRRSTGVVARVVTYGLVLGLALGAWAEVEHWPVTSFRLFSVVRTDRSFGLELVAVTPGGERERVAPTGSGRVVANLSHQLQELRGEPSAERRRRVLALLDLADMDPDRYVQVDLERVERRLDPGGGPSTEVRRTVVAEVDL